MAVTTMGRVTTSIVIGALAAGLIWSFGLGLSETALAKELKLATFLPPQHPTVRLYEELAKALAKDTNGDLTLKIYSGGALGAGPFQQYRRAIQGVADIVDICHPFHAKVFPKTMLIVEPGAANSASDATARLWNIESPYLASDYKDVRNMFLYTVSQAVLISRDKPVRTMADLKGAKVLTPGAAFVPIVQAWGATAIPMDFSEMYNALSTGVVDMVALPATALMPPWRLSEVAKYVTVGLTGLFNPCGAIMNKASYAALSATQKAALDRHMGKNLSMKAGQVFDNWASNALKTATDSKKIEVIELSPSERKVLFDAAKSVIDKTVADLHKNGISDASAAYTALNK